MVIPYASTPPVPSYHLNDAVRLLDGHGDVVADSVGRVLGSFPRPSEITYIVSFVDSKVSVLELHGNEIVFVDDFRAAA
jgi:hypothetical protein